MFIKKLPSKFTSKRKTQAPDTLSHHHHWPVPMSRQASVNCKATHSASVTKRPLTSYRPFAPPLPPSPLEAPLSLPHWNRANSAFRTTFGSKKKPALPTARRGCFVHKLPRPGWGVFSIRSSVQKHKRPFGLMGPSGTSRVKRLLGGHSLQEGNGGKGFGICRLQDGDRKDCHRKGRARKVDRNRFGKKISCQGMVVVEG